MGFLRIGASLSVRGRQLDFVDTPENIARSMVKAGIPMAQVATAYKLMPIEAPRPKLV